jgi:hypothetical protein
MVELMFAIMIFSVVLLGLLGVLSSLVRYQSEGRAYEKVSVAANAIFGQAGEALARDFDKPLVPDLFPAGRQPMANLEGVTFEVMETAERPDLKRVDLTLYWTDERNIEHHKSMTTRFLKER